MTLARLAALAVLLGCAPAGSMAAPEGPRLGFPLACRIGVSCEVQHYVDRDPGPGVRDYRCGRRTYEAHNGIDIRVLDMAAERAGVDVLAAAPGRVARLRDGVADISIRTAGAPSVANQECGNGVVIDHGDGWETQYCHLARGSLKVKVGDAVTAGQPIAHVGLSGKTEFPHLHITVRHAGAVVDPFASASATGAGCTAAAPLWTAAAMSQMGYKAGAVLNAGFAAAPVTMDAVESGGVARPSADSEALIAYARAIELELGDEIEMSLKAPDGAVLAQNRMAPLDHDKAQWLTFIGKKRPPAGWPKGVYAARYAVWRAGKVVLTRDFQVRL